LANIGFSYSDP
jgi:hypothetical protein